MRRNRAIKAVLAGVCAVSLLPVSAFATVEAQTDKPSTQSDSLGLSQYAQSVFARKYYQKHLSELIKKHEKELLKGEDETDPSDSVSEELPVPAPTPAPEVTESEKKDIEEVVTSNIHSDEDGPRATSPLDFESYAQDDPTFNMPDAAQRFADGENFTIGRPEAGGQSHGTVPAGLEEFYSQRINWGSCTDFGFRAKANTECAYVIVPADYSNPQGPTIAVGMYKVAAKDPSNKIGTLFTDPGGPGGSGMESAAHATPMDHFDIVGFDPRGVGNSLPQIRCQSSAAFDAQRAGSDALSGEELDRILKFNTDQCYENTAKNFNGISGETFIPNVGTKNVIQDLDVMRSALGDEKLTYIGYSYGTSIGFQYASKFADNIRALVLDGQVNPFENNPELIKQEFSAYMPTLEPESADVAQMRGFAGTFIQFLKYCMNLPTGQCVLVDEQISEPTQEQIDAAYAKYQEIVQKAYDTGYYHHSRQPSRPVSFADVNMGTIQAMYADWMWQYLALGLKQMVESRDARLSITLADMYFNRTAEGKYDFSDAAFRTISCTDSHEDSTNRQEQADIKRQVIEVAPFNNPGVNADGSQRGVEPSYGWCQYYRHRADLPVGQTLVDIPNVLVLSSTYDPATPFENGVVVADALNGTLVSAANNSHCVYGKLDCATNITNAYLENPQQFMDDYKAGVFNTDEEYTGEETSTKDIFSKVITAKQCQVTHFTTAMDIQRHAKKNDYTVATALDAVKAGSTKQINIKKFVPNVEVSLSLVKHVETPVASTQAGEEEVVDLGTYKVDGLGNLVQTVSLPASTQAGKYVVFATQTATGDNGEVAVLKSRTQPFEVIAAKEEVKSAEGADQAKAAENTSKQVKLVKASEEPLANTGSPVYYIAILALLALAVGTVLVSLRVKEEV